MGWGQALGVLGRWTVSGWGGVGGWARWCSLGAWGCGRWQEGPPQRVCVAGGPAAPGAASLAPPGYGPRPCLSSAGSDFSPSARTPYATGQCVNAGGSGLGAGAQGLRSELQNVCGSGREPGRGCWLSEGQQGAGALGGRVGGRAWRAVTSHWGRPEHVQTPGNWSGDPQTGRRPGWS